MATRHERSGGRKTASKVNLSAKISEAESRLGEARRKVKSAKSELKAARKRYKEAKKSAKEERKGLKSLKRDRRAEEKKRQVTRAKSKKPTSPKSPRALIAGKNERAKPVKRRAPATKTPISAEPVTKSPELQENDAVKSTLDLSPNPPIAATT